MKQHFNSADEQVAALGELVDVAGDTPSKQLPHGRFNRARTAWSLAWILTGWLLGALAWDGQGAPALAVLVPVAAVLARTRLWAYLYWVGYHLAVVRALPAYAEAWFDSPLPGTVSWVLLGLVCAVPWTLLWTRSESQDKVLVMGILGFLLTLLPPVAAVAPGHPLVGWGFILQGWGWGGLCIGALITGYAAARARAVKPTVAFGAILIAGLLLFAWGKSVAPLPMRSVGILHSVGTHFGKPPANDEEKVARLENVGQIVRRLAANPDFAGSILVFPETTLGSYDDTFAPVLRGEVLAPAREAGIHLVLGMEIKNRSGQRYNVATLFSPDESMQVVAQRQPAVVSMWAPWRAGSFTADWGRDTTLRIGKDLVFRVVICYEEFLPFVHLLDEIRGRYLAKVVMSNSWAAGTMGLPMVQRQHTEGMARLFGRTVVRAENLPNR